MDDFDYRLFKWGLRRGVLTGDTVENVWNCMSENTRAFARREIIGRVKGEKALKALDPTLIVKQLFIYSAYDVEYVSGGTVEHTEFKDRTFESTKYSDFMLDSNKKRNPEINVLNTFSDGIFYLWDLRKAPIHSRLNTHNRYTVVDSEKITKEEDFLYPKDAEFTGRYEN